MGESPSPPHTRHTLDQSTDEPEHETAAGNPAAVFLSSHDRQEALDLPDTPAVVTRAIVEALKDALNEGEQLAGVERLGQI